MTKDVVLFRIRQISDDEAIAVERIYIEDVGAGDDVRNKRVRIGVEVRCIDREAALAQFGQIDGQYIMSAGARTYLAEQKAHLEALITQIRGWRI